MKLNAPPIQTPPGTQTQTQTVNPSTNKFDVFRSVVQLVVQIITVVGLILGAYITIRLAPLLASQQSLNIRVEALTSQVDKMTDQDITLAVLSQKIETVNQSISDLKSSMDNTNKLIINHITQSK